MAKNAKTLPRWRISLTGKAVKPIGLVSAPTEAAALQWGARKFKIATALRSRLIARRAE
jgi:hypothetical protein